MEKLYRAQMPRHELKQRQINVDNPIELDNKAFDIKDGDKKSLDYLDYYGTIRKGALAAQGAIKLCPSCKGQFAEHYGVSAPINKSCDEIAQDELPEYEEDIENEWDNIFLNKEDENNNFFIDNQ